MSTQIASRIGDENSKFAPQQLRAMRRIWAKSESTLADLIQTLKRDKGQVGRIIDELCKSGMVVREPNPKDGRSKILRLTPNGYKMFKKVEEIEAEISDQLTKDIDKNDLETFFAVSEKLAENLSDISVA